MATIKLYTDIEQSKKLSTILPLESADMCWTKYIDDGEVTSLHATVNYGIVPIEYPCWSFTALFGILTRNKICHYDDRYYCQYMNEGDEFPIYSTAEYDNPIDACVEMTEKLNELNLL